MKIVGVTGTNGKTTCVHIICQLLKNYLNCASFGTLGINQYFSKQCLTTPTKLTTFGNQELHANLAKVATLGAELVAMEVSSHGLVQDRVANVSFVDAVFTNLSHDHLDYHQDMESYFQAKVRLFTKYGSHLKRAIINLDDNYGVRLIKLLQQIFHKNLASNKFEIIGFSTNPRIKLQSLGEDVKKIINCEQISYREDGVVAEIHSPWGAGKIKTTLLGIHNLSNLLASMAVCITQISWHAMLEQCGCLTPPRGRLEPVVIDPNFSSNCLGSYSSNYSRVIIDYAHTPAGLANSLVALQSHYSGKKICCIFGCGGNRDRSKRPVMLQVAEQYSDVIIITQDNPRDEDPSSIIADILKHKITSENVRLIVELDRKEAIKLAITNYYADHIILIAGKGHETIQIIKEKNYYFSDHIVAREILATIN